MSDNTPADIDISSKTNQDIGNDEAMGTLPSQPPPIKSSAITAKSTDDEQHLAGDQVAKAIDESSTFPQIADDNDLIEKEWVQSAKKIVARTSNDPHLQNQVISRFKADYLKKRFNKDITLNEDK